MKLGGPYERRPCCWLPCRVVSNNGNFAMIPWEALTWYCDTWILPSQPAIGSQVFAVADPRSNIAVSRRRLEIILIDHRKHVAQRRGRRRAYSLFPPPWSIQIPSATTCKPSSLLIEGRRPIGRHLGRRSVVSWILQQDTKGGE